MLSQQQQIDLLLARGINRTQFETVRVPFSLTNGIRLGDGKCTAVILRLNQLVRNDADGAATNNTILQMYYGDSTKQEYELLRGVDSQIIFAKDLSEVYLRNPYANDFAGSEQYVQAIIYHNDILEQYERETGY